jgi:hypothetical protein
MSQIVTYVDAGGAWEMLFVGNECVEEDHSIPPYRVARVLKNVEYDTVRRWDATASKSDTSFVDREDRVAMYLRQNGVSFLFED